MRRCLALGRLLLLLPSLAACAGDPEGPPRQPAGWDDAIRLPEAVDINPAPDVVELNLDARVAPFESSPGLVTQAWTYDGLLPGPLIRARPGDRVVVHFTNHLPEGSTIHWHGVRVPPEMDGVAGHSQAPVDPGGAFDYAFTVSDESLFWYHPHVDSAVQVGYGLYGPLLVEDRAAAETTRATFGDEVVLVLSDLGIKADGSLEDPQSGGDIGTLFGREGNLMLVNGRVKPTLLARNGLRQRWRIVNAAKSRYFQLALEGHTFTRIGSDGGLITAPVVSDRVLVIPGGRADVIVTPTGAPDAQLTVRWVATDRGFGTAYMRPDEDLFYVRVVGGPAPAAPPPLPETLRAIAPLDTSNPVFRDIALTMDTTSGALELGIDGVPSWEAKAYEARLGETDLWTINNQMGWDHPFHLHGFSFQQVDLATGIPVPEWLDTFNVPAMDTRQMVVRYDDRPGMWMFHCHILDHADAGMMGMIMLE